MFTHRKIIRQVKQGINASIANHLEYLSAQRNNVEDLSPEKILLNNGIERCKIWAEKNCLVATPTNSNATTQLISLQTMQQIKQEK